VQGKVPSAAEISISGSISTAEMAALQQLATRKAGAAAGGAAGVAAGAGAGGAAGGAAAAAEAELAEVEAEAAAMAEAMAEVASRAAELDNGSRKVRVSGAGVGGEAPECVRPEVSPSRYEGDDDASGQDEGGGGGGAGPSRLSCLHSASTVPASSEHSQRDESPSRRAPLR
jgi:hypothetical protein